MMETKEWLYKQANANSWYKWVAFTGEQIKAKDCYVCSRNRQDALYVTNTKYTWKLSTKTRW